MLRNPLRLNLKVSILFYKQRIKRHKKNKKNGMVKIKEDCFFTPQQHQVSKRLFSRRVKVKVVN